VELCVNIGFRLYGIIAFMCYCFLVLGISPSLASAGYLQYQRIVVRLPIDKHHQPRFAAGAADTILLSAHNHLVEDQSSSADSALRMLFSQSVAVDRCVEPL
jgi:hypothetical protein